MSTTPIYVEMVERFRQLQKEAKFRDSVSLVYAKWDMKTAMEDIGDIEEFEILIQFFMLTSDDKSFRYFFGNYKEYYEAMLRVRADRAHRRALRRQTFLKKEKTKGDDVGS